MAIGTHMNKRVRMGGPLLPSMGRRRPSPSQPRPRCMISDNGMIIMDAWIVINDGESGSSSNTDD